MLPRLRADLGHLELDLLEPQQHLRVAPPEHLLEGLQRGPGGAALGGLLRRRRPTATPLEALVLVPSLPEALCNDAGKQPEHPRAHEGDDAGQDAPKRRLGHNVPISDGRQGSSAPPHRDEHAVELIVCRSLHVVHRDRGHREHQNGNPQRGKQLRPHVRQDCDHGAENLEVALDPVDRQQAQHPEGRNAAVVVLLDGQVHHQRDQGTQVQEHHRPDSLK
mmetsp:Transcript_51834/g.154824  ORF Transcript_51834/g.154824 Transcript_51834/m.154824 type:complete len:220 (-) Transcript_51834:8-667(-)